MKVTKCPHCQKCYFAVEGKPCPFCGKKEEEFNPFKDIFGWKDEPTIGFFND
jgi:hypothetical protein